MTDDKPRIVATERAFAGWNRLDVVTIEAKNAAGKLERHAREIVDHGDAAAVLLIDRVRDTGFLVRQWRTGLIRTSDPFLLEVCAGIIDAGETPEETARREAEEEVGLTIGTLRSLGSILPSIGTLTERVYLFVGEVSAASRNGNGGGRAEEGEVIEVVEMPLATLFAMARDGRIEDGKTLIILQHLMLEAASSPSSQRSVADR